MDKEVIEAFERMAIDWRAREVHAAEIDLIRAYLTDPGYRRVPVEPTDEMLYALIGRSYIGTIFFDELKQHMIEKYKDMLTASQGEG